MKLIIKIVFLFCLVYVSTPKDIQIFFRRYLSTYNKQYCNVSIVFRPLNRTSKLYSTDIYFSKEVKLEAPIYIEITAYKKFRTLYRQHMLKMKEELCGQLSLKNHPIFGLFKTAGLPIEVGGVGGNLLDPCPLFGHRYSLPAISHIDTHILPLIPVGEWIFEFRISKDINKSIEKIFSLSAYVEIKPTGATEF